MDNYVPHRGRVHQLLGGRYDNDVSFFCGSGSPIPAIQAHMERQNSSLPPSKLLQLSVSAGLCTCSLVTRFLTNFQGLIILGIILDQGGGPDHDRLGFRFWKDPGPFVQYHGIPGVKGRFLGWWAVMTQAAFSFIGTEIVAVCILTASR